MKESWIKIEDGLPEEEINVLACNVNQNHEFFYIAYLWDGLWIDSMTDNTIEVTHWQYCVLPSK